VGNNKKQLLQPIFLLECHDAHSLQVDSLTGANEFGCSQLASWREEVQAPELLEALECQNYIVIMGKTKAYLITVAPDPSCSSRCVGPDRQLGPLGKSRQRVCRRCHGLLLIESNECQYESLLSKDNPRDLGTLVHFLW
jgi:hypothetical protein